MKNLVNILMAILVLGQLALAQETAPQAQAETQSQVQTPSPAPTAPRLTLKEAVAATIRQNPDLLAAGSASEAAKYAVDQAAAGYSPTLSLSTNYTHSDSTRGSTSVVSGGQLLYNGSGSGGNSIQDSLSSSLNARLPLYDATLEPNLRQAKESKNATQYDQEKTAQELILQVRTAYFQTLLDQQLIEIQQQGVLNNQLRVKQAQGFYEAGTAAKVEVTQAQAALSSAELELSKAQAALEVDWVTLNTLMGQPSQASYELEAPTLPAIPDWTADSLMKVAADQRPELQAGWSRIKAQLARVDAAVAGRFPTLSASMGYNLNGQPTPFNRTWSAGIVFSWALFDGGADRARAAQAKATAEQLTHQVESTSNSVYKEIATALTGWRTSKVQYATAQVGLEAAQQNRTLAAERYRVGVGSSLELSNADLSLTQARSDLAQALKASQTAAAQLARAVGIVDLEQLQQLKDMS